jgi:hypothetical protein
MATLLREVVSYLEDQGVGVFGTSLFIGFEPTSPKNCVTIYPSGGRPPKALGGKEFPTMLVRIRNEKYSDGYNKAEDIFGLLHKQMDFLDTFRGRCFALQSSPIFLGHGENGEFIFTQNYIWYLAYNPNTSSSSSSSFSV